MKTYLSVVLHAHLPFIRHPEDVYHLEEMWFYEAMHETYLPLLMALDRLEQDQVPGTLTLSLSAPLLAMMADGLLAERFVAQLERMIALARADRETRGAEEPRLAVLADFYEARFDEMRTYYLDELQQDVLARFAHHARRGRLELMTCVGTHPILPFLESDAGRRAQIRAGLQEFESHFGFKPRGVWIAECAFAPGVDRLLADEGIGFACLEDVGILTADAPPVYGTYASLVSPAGVAFFGRDQLASAQVWSASEGYPGDYDYREFYRDLGYDLPLDVVLPYIHPDGIRHHTGLKYHRVTGEVGLGEKEYYRPDVARNRALDHARHFVHARRDQGNELFDKLGERPAHLTCSYDAELFGHWWFEGPLFLEAVFREAAHHDDLVLSSPASYLSEEPVQQQATPGTSTWGEDSYFGVWLDPSNAWIYRHLRNAEHRVVELSRAALHGGLPSDPLTSRALAQLGRQLLLAQASDWAFIMKTGTTVEYAQRRQSGHLRHIEELAAMLEQGTLVEAELAVLEDRYPIFKDLDPSWWAESG
ncbi:DUF1957 domain-containing protein [Lujinxingia litoralis]|uniref:DUF1957 domain-containing protein n=1 Tax=Lujinxingia litoralis TaxID=2211119 RepID=A0A328C1Q4_9DELT|nr:1,4-alpha-glucan branching protein domain-containing protein [Lujinxingia litoralis]RAL20353.1 DUF1957 domain-containing protein [Lujinxingia litoralis]